MFNLQWKEWHEQRWKLAFGCIVMGALLAMGLRARLIPDQTMLLITCWISIVLLPLLAGIGLLPPERSEGSLETFCALPIRPRRIMAAKALVGMAVCACPMLVLLAVTFLIAGQREMNGLDVLSLVGRTTLAVLSLFFWYLAATARLSGEARAGLISLGVLICWLLLTLGLDDATLGQYVHGDTFQAVHWRPIVAVTPFVGVFDVENQMKLGPTMWFAAFVQIAIAAALWWSTLGALRNADRGAAD